MSDSDDTLHRLDQLESWVGRIHNSTDHLELLTRVGELEARLVVAEQTAEWAFKAVYRIDLDKADARVFRDAWDKRLGITNRRPDP